MKIKEWENYLNKKSHLEVVKLANSLFCLDKKVKQEFEGLTELQLIAEHIATKKYLESTRRGSE